MGTKIEWAEETWNPITGCTPISEGCQNCYAKRMANRLRGRCGYPVDDPFKVTFHPERLSQLAKWKSPRRIFVSSMGDLFHGEVEVDGNAITLIFDAAAKASHHTYIFLTKRPNNMLAAFRHYLEGEPFPANWWVGVTCENQKRADERIPVLLDIPAMIRFVSVEPMLEKINLRKYLLYLELIICGGETGQGARPMEYEWAIDLKTQCQAWGVAFFFKKHGDVFRRKNKLSADDISSKTINGVYCRELP